MTSEEFATQIDEVLDEAEDSDLPLEDQIAVLQRILDAMRAALT